MTFNLILPVIILSSLVLTGCFGDSGGGGGVSFTNGPASGTGSGGLVTISIVKIQNATESAWIIDSLQQIYTTDSNLSIEGTCSRGVSKIKATVNGSAVTEESECSVEGTFAWTKTLPAITAAIGTSYDVVLQAAQPDGTLISGVTSAKTIVLDKMNPSAPIIDAVAGCGLSSAIWICPFSNVTVTGSWSSSEGVKTVQSPSGGTMSYPTAATFSFAVNLAEGETKILNFTTTDLAGNISGTSSVTVSYAPSISVLASSLNGGGTNGFAGGPSGVNPSMIGSVGGMSGVFIDSLGSGTNDQKVQLHMGPVAVGAKQLNP